MKYSKLLKRKDLGVVKSSFPLYEKPDMAMFCAEAQMEWLRCEKIYKEKKHLLDKDEELICPFCKEKMEKYGVESEFCIHADLFRRF